MKRVKKFLTAVAAIVSVLFVAHATSIREFQKMSAAEQTKFLVKETGDLLAQIKAYDPKLEEKTHDYMYVETNAYGYAKGMAAVVGTIDYAERKRPETLDKAQVEGITKVVMRAYWKSSGIAVPASIFSANAMPHA